MAPLADFAYASPPGSGGLVALAFNLFPPHADANMKNPEKSMIRNATWKTLATAPNASDFRWVAWTSSMACARAYGMGEMAMTRHGLSNIPPSKVFLRPKAIAAAPDAKTS